MSRRNNLSEPAYGQIKLKCPYKHDLGAILVNPGRLDPLQRPTRRQTFHRIAAALPAPELTEHPDGKIEMQPEPPVDI
jgi:hypothetical protein